METSNSFQDPRLGPLIRTWGFWGLVTGGLAMIVVMIQIIGPVMEPQPSIGTQVGELAGEIRRSAWRSFLGVPHPEPEVVQASWWDKAVLMGPVFGVIAIVLSAISGALRENKRIAAYGAGLGALSIVFIYLWWLALLIAGVIVLMTVLQNMDGIFGI